MAAMLISLAAGAAHAQCSPREIANLTASDAADGDSFSASVVMMGDTAVFGAYLDDNVGGADAGAAYVFVRSGPPGAEVWTQQAKLIASDAAAGDQLGFAIAMSGDTVVVGAWLDALGDETNVGSAYVFVRSHPSGSGGGGGGGGAVWTQQAKLIASDAAEGDGFGYSVAILGDTLVIGSYDDDIDGKENAGSAYVFVRSGPPGSEVWTQQAKLIASDAAAYDTLGFSVAMLTDTAVVGAASDDHAGGVDAGSAYVFVRSGPPGAEVWTERTKLTTSDAQDADLLGYSMAASGDTVVIGAYRDDHSGVTNAGSARVFVRSGPPGREAWTQQATLIASDAADNDYFGWSVGLSDDTALVGARRDDHSGASDAGSAYVFVRSGPSGGGGGDGGGAWTQQAKLTASDPAEADVFGDAVALAGDTAVIGARLDNHAGGADAGSASIFDLAGCGPSCLGDLDGGGSVNGLDLALLLGQWTGAATYAPCPPHQPQDLNQDCKVNGVDLATLLGAWGLCP